MPEPKKYRDRATRQFWSPQNTRTNPNPRQGAIEDSEFARGYRAIKAQNPNKIILARVGSFYEVHGNQDASIVSDVLGITLTRRNSPNAGAMAGFPRQALGTYLPRLVRAGHRLEIVDRDEIIRRGRNR